MVVHAIENHERMGHWCVLVWPRFLEPPQVVALALYNADEELVFSRRAPLLASLTRNAAHEVFFLPPPTWVGMKSMITISSSKETEPRWMGGYPTLRWTKHNANMLYEEILGT